MLRYHGKCHRGSMTQVLRDLKKAANEDQEPIPLKEVLCEIDLIQGWVNLNFDILRWEWKTLQVEGSA